LEETEKYMRMYTAPIQFTFANGEFPANNDGWPEQALNDKTSYYEVACGSWQDPVLLQTLANLYANAKRTSVEALLYGPTTLPAVKTLPQQSVLFKESGVGFLRNESVNAYIKFGPYNGGHDHFDRLNLILYGLDRVLMPDLGTSGYGIPLNQWYRSSAAHNLLVVDGRRQARCDGYFISFDDEAVEAGVKDAYEGVNIRRKLQLRQNGVTDTVTAQSDQSHRYDLFYHVRGTIAQSNLQLTPVDNFKQSNGYDYLRAIQSGNCEDEMVVVWNLRGTKGTLTMRCTSPIPFTVFTGTCPDQPANRELGFLMMRADGENVEFNTEILILNHAESLFGR
jgi:hypothetical protein